LINSIPFLDRLHPHKLTKRPEVIHFGARIPIQNNTPSDRFEQQGETWEKEKDLTWNKLESLASKAKDSNDPEIKKQLIEQERKVMEEEFQMPEKFYSRVQQTGGFEKRLNSREERILHTQMNAMVGLIEYFNYKVGHKEEVKFDQESYCKTFTKILKEKPDTAQGAEVLKTWAMHLASGIHRFMDTEHQTQIENLAEYILENSPYAQCKEAAMGLFRGARFDKSKPILEQFKQAYLECWQNQSNPQENRQAALITLCKLEAESIKPVLTDILEGRHPESGEAGLQTIAAWGAGNIKTENNARCLVKILKDKLSNNKEDKLSNEQLQFIEMCINAISQYADDKPDTVKKILTTIQENSSHFDHLATALLEKIEKRGQEQDYFINKILKAPSEKDDYRTAKDKYIENANLLDTEQQNWVDIGLLPFRKFLDFFNRSKYKAVLTRDGISDELKNKTGKRTDDGRFYDMLGGLATSNNGYTVAITSIGEISKPFESEQNIVAHEMSHQFLFALRKFDRDAYHRLEEIYEKAKTEKRLLSDYCKDDIDEYWAVGYETYLLPYKPYPKLIEFNEKQAGSSTTSSVLKRQDPALYNFIEDMIKQYGISEVGVQKALKHKGTPISIQIKVS
jgi:hypothetical protein